MAVTTTARLGITRWSAGSDAFSRTQMEASHQALEEKAAGFLRGTFGTRPAAAAANLGFIYEATDLNNLMFWSTGAAWVRIEPGVRTMDTTARDALSANQVWVGRQVWNTTTGKLEMWDGDSWEPIATGTVSDGTSTLTTKGDLLTRTTSGLARVPVGTNGLPLVANSSDAEGFQWGGAMTLDGNLNTGTGVLDINTAGMREAFLPITSSGTVALMPSTVDAETIVRHAPSGNVTYTLSANQIPSGWTRTVTLILVFGGTLHSITWPIIRWPGGTAPTFAINTTNVITLVGVNNSGSVNWYAGSPLLDLK